MAICTQLKRQIGVAPVMEWFMGTVNSQQSTGDTSTVVMSHRSVLLITHYLLITLPTPYSLLPTSYFRSPYLPTPYSLLPTSGLPTSSFILHPLSLRANN